MGWVVVSDVSDAVLWLLLTVVVAWVFDSLVSD